MSSGEHGQVGLVLTLPLYPYQEPAVDLFLGRGSLLVAYEMGLGKTPIAIACCESLLGNKDITRALLVVPASLRYQWAMSLAAFTDLPTQVRVLRGQEITIPHSDACVIVDGSAATRRDQLCSAIRTGAEYVICSYETVTSDTRYIKRLKPGLVVLDEASAIKNFGAQRTRRVKTTLMSDYRLALTGTPVENKPEEVFSIMEWVDPNVLGPFDLFDRVYIERDKNGSVIRHKNTHLLHRKLDSAMSRRSRKDPDVASYLPDVDHDQWYIDMDSATRQCYELMADDLLQALLAIKGRGSFDLGAYYAGNQSFDENSGIGKVMARQQAIEMFLDSPWLVERSDTKYCTELWNSGSLDGALDPKLRFLVDKVSDILDFPENKLLIFSRYPYMLSLIGAQINDRYVMYHGGMNAKDKAAAIARYTNDPLCRVFLSSHAGAYGTDMRMANYLINYDLPWSGGTWDQINGRHQRVSSEFGTVYVRDLVMRDTIEERKLAILKHKLKIAEAVIDGKAPKTGRIDNDLVSLTAWLQS
jgi:SNF2 family DNA or RNA helicase